jgi:hypothetical protein
MVVVSGRQSPQPGVVGDANPLAFDELAEEGELLFIGHEVWGAANLSLGDEHFQMSHDLVFELLV